ncbi:aminopeptidase N, partial [Desulfobacterales bacterium HSG16]|nr:aminopeptidase N [Desulfobacterales bacterium HSG16]
IVAVDNFNMGAMENKGLNIFNSKYVLAKPDTATDEDFLNIERVIAHEYFHNWTGNRVTLKNWFQLSLKEGLTVFRDQEFAADMSSAAVKRISDVAKLRIFQFPEDAGPTAHPVLPESYIEMNNFYTMTVYEKGSEIIRMIRLLTGREGFRKGMDLYFERFDGMAVTCEDFVKTMEDANNIDLAQFRLWYSQAGTPIIRFERKWDENEKSFCLTLVQDCPKTPGQDKKLPMHIPVEIGLLDSTGGQLPLQLAGEKKASGTSRILDFTHAKQDFTFVNIDPAQDENLRKNGPVPSLFRKFSAPVKLVAGYTEDERIFLMGNDPDPFNRWDAGQQLFSSMILSLIDDFQNKKELVINSALLEAFEKTLTASSDLTADKMTDKIMDKAFAALALRLPSESELGEMMAGRGLIIDPDGIFHVRKFVISHLAEEFSAIFTQIYEQNSVKGPYSIDSEAIARRSLKNLALFYLGRKESNSMIPLVYTQFENADNMTDAIAALLILGDTDTPERKKAFDTFYQRWQSDTLVLDKWFALQAVSNLPDTLDRVKELMDHPAFSIKNPNKVRSLVFAFCNGNSFRFHDTSGSGYEFITDRILELNTLNPQIGARLVAAFNHWRKYDADRQGLMKTQLEKILDTPKLSKDIFEIVSKAVA